ncbi:RNA-binding region-containing protein 3-like isoform X2 [Nilaparvata lugens]|uniref:RNA-binding region-containing protein 3-like isoform X2 n=1 Tax=Nilaparvata lugens TaxID=108931 RepID=UPI00193D4F34|nr:RNA-binding region-containing protein 3-like isoform X2 [Nilaparvata lugens]XP_039283797.1 RNA-binding region-containing protein 3-like isoform X2 [Nilaparvata lugens]
MVIQNIQTVDDESKTRRYHETFLHKLNSWSNGLDLNAPPPVHLTYQYPPPSKSVLSNICKTLAVVPKFYTQVLHLMNRMNLPCPFTESFSIESSLVVDNTPDDRSENQSASEIGESLTAASNKEDNESDAESEESEIESDGSLKQNEVFPLKRKTQQNKGISKVKRLKLLKQPQLSGPCVKNVIPTEEVFEKVSSKDIQSKKIQMKITSDLSSIQEAEETQKGICTVEGFEKLPARLSAANEQQKESMEERDEEMSSSATCITEQQLAANRISTRDQRILPVFKNYQTGPPSCRLYIKNLAKQVQTKDLHFIYRRYLLPSEDEQGTMFDIRLMQEGRMKGQAFVTLQSVEIAQRALKETNGFILKDKPMVVQFARSATVK